MYIYIYDLFKKRACPSSRVSRTQAWRKQRVSIKKAWLFRNSRVSKIFEHILKTWRAEGRASSAQAWRKHFRSCAEGA